MTSEDNTEKKQDNYKQHLSGLADLIAQEKTNIPDYVIRYSDSEKIAEGGMKSINSVYDAHTQRQVAMALMHGLHNEDIRQQFLHEARITARLEHPNIMPVYDIGRDPQGTPFFTMKLIRGKNLGDLLKARNEQVKQNQAAMTLNELLEIFIKVCDAVSCAHSQNILHLDLKPDNIQVGEFGEVLVCDWGLSRYLGETAEENLAQSNHDREDAGLTRHSGAFGTPGFMAPEQVTQKRHELDKAADIYALGSILYNTLSGKSPFSGKAPQAKMILTAQGKVPPPATKLAEKKLPLAPALDAVCLKAMNLSPEQRYSSADELKIEVRSWLNGFATRAEEASLLRQILLLTRRHRIACSAIFAAIIAIAISTSFFIDKLQQKNHSLLAVAEEARRSEEKVLRTLEQVQQEQREKKQITEHATPLIADKIVEATNRLDFSSALSSLKKAVLLTPKNDTLQRIQAMFSLSSQDFPKAFRLLSEHGDNSTSNYLEFCRQHQATAAGNLSPSELSRLCLMLQKDNLDSSIIQLLITQKKLTPSAQQRQDLAQGLLKAFNPEVRQLHFSAALTPDNKLSLDLSNNKNLKEISALLLLDLTELKLSDCPVKDISSLGLQQQLTHLSLSNTQVIELTSLQNCPLKSLQMLGIIPVDFTPLKQIKTLTNLYLSDNKILKKRLSQVDLPDSIHITWQ